MTVRGAEAKIAEEVSSWEGVSSGPHRFGGTEFRFGKRELGHIHGDELADIVLPIDLRNRLVKEGKVEAHRYVPSSGWITFRFRGKEDVATAIGLFRMSFEIARGRLSNSGARQPPQTAVPTLSGAVAAL